MNKLDVALKLLQLLNERKIVDSKTVAHELNVSIRTAQRYLVELSILPCVMTNQDQHSYMLNPDYRLNGALSGGEAAPVRGALSGQESGPNQLAQHVCLLCGNARLAAQGVTTIVGPPHSNNLARINRLAALIAKRLKNNKCPFP